MPNKNFKTQNWNASIHFTILIYASFIAVVDHATVVQNDFFLFIYFFRNLCNRQSLNAFLERRNYSCTTIVCWINTDYGHNKKTKRMRNKRKVSDEWCVEYTNYIIIWMIKTIFSIRAVWCKWEPNVGYWKWSVIDMIYGKMFHP